MYMYIYNNIMCIYIYIYSCGWGYCTVHFFFSISFVRSSSLKAAFATMRAVCVALTSAVQRRIRAAVT